MWRRSTCVILIVAFCAALFLACASSKPKRRGPGGTGNLVSGTLFTGTVVDDKDAPVERARVEVNGRETFTGADGSFRLNVVAEGAEYILNITHPDFADLSHVTRKALENQRWKLVRAQTETVDPTGPVTLVDRRPGLAIGGATFSLPPNALVDPRGNPPVGPVRASIATLDVSNGEGPGDWAVRSDDGRQEGFLVSYGAVFVQFSDATGTTKYQLRPGQVGSLSLPVIPNMKTVAPATPTARFWYYDTADGYWKHNGDATFDTSTGAYTGTVNHLSTINTDIAKFNAACLKVTLDPSVPFGRKLRIRYHSGDTPFGQTPTFVLDAVDNAAYRLPANNNVLLELLDGVTNEAFGDFIVEDPPGTPLVNTVVNMGPALPMGANLWPPPPYTPCKAILIKQGLPQVEIRINEMPADPAIRDNPSDDYLTWAPTFARARLASPGMPVTVVLTNDTPGAIPGGGDVLFAQHQTPWPVNTTATATTLTLNLPANGDWVPFMIAGRFNFPSRNDKDTIVEAHLNSAVGAIVGTKAMMVRVRKNANTLTTSEKGRYLFAWRKFRNQLGANYVRFQEMHRLASTIANDQGHQNPAFLPWHRVMLLHVERELQKIDPSVALHYWNWDAAAPNVFASDFIGAADFDPMDPFDVAEPIFSAANPLNGWNTDLPFSGGELRRNRQDHTLAPVAGFFKPLDDPDPMTPSLVDEPDYGPYDSFDQFGWEVEALAHNGAHGWPCAGGHVALPTRSAADPLFYLLHSNTDRQWAYWQRAQNRHGVDMGGVLTFTAPQHYDNNGVFDAPGETDHWKGAFLDDGQWPWDGTSGGVGRAQRPLNQAGGPGQNVPNSMPLIPMSPFPASAVKNLWPAADATPRPRNFIDYLGKFLPQDGLGFCYDDVPFN